MTTTDAVDRRLDWLLTDFARGTRSVVHAIVVSGDGLTLAGSEGIDVGLADRLAAATSGLVSLARGTARLLRAEPVAQTIVEMAGGYLFVTTIAEASTLAVFARPNCDLGMIGYEMTLLASRVGHALTPAMRARARGVER